ncbi:hypothetical protein [Chitinophaga agri]|uniref:Uncharacterized protein n=1 Tax=Chitinophaga agri TaxID=2703787 RepID=A0A6B9ZDB7_9BACT|nr:hypothetical protein [Chitinophaga agri]QHS59481.1 hypothetical protein GWR21_07740 [Chitinophaga agri]
MTNIKQGQQSPGNNTHNEHISTNGKKERDDDIFLQPDEDNTLQTPEEFAKDKGSRLEDEDEISVNTEE